jgi:hypothetical protein
MNMQSTSRGRLLSIGLGLTALFLCLVSLVALAVTAYFYFWRGEATSQGPAVHYVMDVSGRMDQPAAESGASRLAVARNVMAEVLRPSQIAVTGLRVFGSGAVASGCEDTDLLVPPAPDSRPQITAELETLRAGSSADAALAQAMIAAIGDLATVPGPKSLVVVTGGHDSCQVEAGRLVAQEAQRVGVALQTFVIGFQVAPAEAEAIKEIAAAAGDGLYLDAPDEGSLRQIVEAIQRYVENPVPENLEAIAAWQATGLPDALNLTQNPGLSYGPQLALDNDNQLHLVWWDNSERNRGEVLYRQRTAGGDWGAVESVTAEFDAHIAQYEVQLRLRPDGAVCAFWTVLDELQYYQRCRSNGGWQPAQPIYPAPGIRRSFQPAFAPDGDLHIIHLDGAGDIYSGDLKLSDDLAASANPKLIVDSGGRMHAAWFRYGEPYTIEYRWSDDGGRTWAAVESLVVAATADVSPLTLKADAHGGIHLAWSAEDTLYYRRWTLAGGWEPVAVVNSDSGRAQCDNIGLDLDQDGMAHVAWHAYTGLYYARQQAGQAWTQPRLVSGEPCTFSRVPVLAVGSAGQVHLIWSPNEPESDLYYAILAPAESP